MKTGGESKYQLQVKDIEVFPFVSFRYQFLLPFITPEYVGEKVVQAVLTDTDTLYLPPYIFIAVFLMQ